MLPLHMTSNLFITVFKFILFVFYFIILCYLLQFVGVLP